MNDENPQIQELSTAAVKLQSDPKEERMQAITTITNCSAEMINYEEFKGIMTTLIKIVCDNKEYKEIRANAAKAINSAIFKGANVSVDDAKRLIAVSLSAFLQSAKTEQESLLAIATRELSRWLIIGGFLVTVTGDEMTNRIKRVAGFDEKPAKTGIKVATPDIGLLRRSKRPIATA